MNYTFLRRLQVEFMAKEAIPNGGGFGDGIEFLKSPRRIGDAARKGIEVASAAIGLLRSAAEPNPYKDKTDEQIAEHIMREIWKRRGRCQKCGGNVYQKICFTCGA